MVIAYFTLPLIILRSVLLGHGFLIWGDNNGPMNTFQWLSELHRFESLWDPYFLAGRPLVALTGITNVLARVFFMILSGSVESALKSFSVFSLALPGIGMYFMSYSFSRRRLGAFLAGFLYMINPWTIDRFLSGHVDMLIAYGVIPIAFALLHQSINERRCSKTLLAGTVGSIVSIQLHMFYLLLGIFTIYGVFLFLITLRKTSVKFAFRARFSRALRDRLAPPLFAVMIMLLLNAYWIIPLRNAQIQLSSHFPPEEHLFILSREGNIVNALRMSTYWWRYLDHTAQAMLTPQLFYLWYGLSILLFVLLLGSVLLDKSKLTIFFSLLLILGVFLSQGANPPFGVLYIYLFNNFPFFNAFREPSKFVVLTALGYSYLLSILINHLAPAFSVKSLRSRINWNPKKIHKNFLALVALIVLIAGLVFPFFVDGTFGGHVRLINFPGEYEDFLGWLAAQSGDYRIALFPPDWEIKYDWAPYSITDPLSTYPIKPTILMKDLEYANEDNRMAWWLYHNLYSNNTKYVGKLYGLMGVRFFVVREDAHPYSYSGGLMSFSDKPASEYLSKQAGLELVYKKGNISVYENRYAFPHIYGADNITLAVADRNILNSLAYADYSFSKYPIAFVHDLESNKIVELMPFIKYVVIDPNKYFDLLFRFADHRFLMNLDDFVGNTQYSDNYWISSDYTLPLYPGIFDAELEKFAYTSGNATIKLPLETFAYGNHEVWIRLFRGRDVSKLTLKIDGNFSLETDDHKLSYERGFEWIRLGSANLQKGTHSLEIRSSGTNAVSRIAVIPEGYLDTVKYQVDDFMNRYGVKIVYVSEGENLNFLGDSWASKVDFETSNGYALASMNGNANLTLYIPNEADYTFNIRLSKFTDGANIRLVVNHDYSIPFGYWSSDVSTRSRFGWVYLDKIHLRKGANNITLSLSNGIFVDELIALPQSSFYRSDLINIDPHLWSFEYQEYPAIGSYEISDNGLAVEMTANATSSDAFYVLDYRNITTNAEAAPNALLRLKLSGTGWMSLNFYEDDEIKGAFRFISPSFGSFEQYLNLADLLGNVTINDMKLILHNPQNKSSEENSTILTTLESFSLNRIQQVSDFTTISDLVFGKTEFSRLTPSKFTVVDNSSSVIVFLESYDTGWDMSEKSAIPVWGYANMFINEEKNNVVEFIPERYYDIGKTVTLTSLILIIFTLSANWIKVKKKHGRL